jgi:hypothetical protein
MSIRFQGVKVLYTMSVPPALEKSEQGDPNATYTHAELKALKEYWDHDHQRTAAVQAHCQKIAGSYVTRPVVNVSAGEGMGVEYTVALTGPDAEVFQKLDDLQNDLRDGIHRYAAAEGRTTNVDTQDAAQALGTLKSAIMGLFQAHARQVIAKDAQER